MSEDLVKRLLPELLPEIRLLAAKLVKEVDKWKTKPLYFRSQASVFMAKLIHELFRDVYPKGELAMQTEKAADYMQQVARKKSKKDV